MDYNYAKIAIYNADLFKFKNSDNAKHDDNDGGRSNTRLDLTLVSHTIPVWTTTKSEQFNSRSKAQKQRLAKRESQHSTHNTNTNMNSLEWNWKRKVNQNGCLEFVVEMFWQIRSVFGI